MADLAVTALVARALSEGLVHPGDDTQAPFVLPLGIFRNTGIPPEMAAQFARDAGLPSADIAKLTAEAAVHTIEAAGNTIIGTAELEALRARAEARPPIGKQRLRLHCTACHNLVLGLPPLDLDNPTVNGPQMLNQIAAINHACPHGLAEADH